MQAMIEKRHNQIDMTYRDLAQLIWGIPTDAVVDHVGTGASLQQQLKLTLAISLGDFRQDVSQLDDAWLRPTLTVQPSSHRSDRVAVSSNLKYELPVAQRGYFNLVAYLAEHLSGRISEDNGVTWLTLAEFKRRHNDLMTADFDKLLAVSIDLAQHEQPVAEHRIAD